MQYVRRIEAQIAVRFCAICSIYIMLKALGDILAVSILIGGCVFYSRLLIIIHSGICKFYTKLACNSIIMIPNDTVSQPIRQGMIGLTEALT